MKILRKLVITLVLIASISTIVAGMVISYENIRKFAYDDNDSAIYVYTNKSGDKVLKFFDSKVNLSELGTGALMSMRGISSYLSRNLGSVVEKFKRFMEHIKICIGVPIAIGAT